jgi:rhodanese-related sulfurtransferase
VKTLSVGFLLIFCTAAIAVEDYLSIVDGKTRAFWSFAISTTEVAERLQGKSPPILIDIREKEEYDESHLAKARFISFRSFEITKLSDLPKDQPIILYCTIGYRSGKVARMLSDAGFTNVHHIRGGIIQWFNEGREVVRDGKPVNEIHPYSDEWKRFIRRKEM